MWLAETDIVRGDYRVNELGNAEVSEIAPVLVCAANLDVAEHEATHAELRVVCSNSCAPGYKTMPGTAGLQIARRIATSCSGSHCRPSVKRAPASTPWVFWTSD